MKVRLGALVALMILLVGGVAACGAGAHVDTTNATVIDVRTASEYAAGHLKGAVNIDVQSSGFATQVGALPKDGKYLLYCRSGARAGTALTSMKQLGFTNVTNLGGIDAASASTGLPIVT